MGNGNSGEIRYTIGGKEETLPAMTAGFFEMPKDRDNFNMAPVKDIKTTVGKSRRNTLLLCIFKNGSKLFC